MEAARHESDPQLVHAAVHARERWGLPPQLLALYHDTNDPKVKADVISGLIPRGPKGADALGSIASSSRIPNSAAKRFATWG